MCSGLKILAATLALCTCLKAGAQNFCLGVDSSPKGFGISCMFKPDEKVFNQLSICADTYGVLFGRTDEPGIRASWLHEFSFAELVGADCVFDFYAGAGVTTGYVHDFEGLFFESNKTSFSHPKGILAALAGNIGCRLSFKRNLSLALSFQGDFGLHIARDINRASTSVTLYHNGIYHLALPQISILLLL